MCLISYLPMRVSGLIPVRLTTAAIWARKMWLSLLIATTLFSNSMSFSLRFSRDLNLRWRKWLDETLIRTRLFVPNRVKLSLNIDPK